MPHKGGKHYSPARKTSHKLNKSIGPSGGMTQEMSYGTSNLRPSKKKKKIRNPIMSY